MYLLGTITVGAGAALNNNDTAVPFTIPAESDVSLQSDTDGVQFEFSSSATYHTTAAKGAFIPAANLAQGPFGTLGTAPVVSVFNPTGGTVNVNVYRNSGVVKSAR